MIYDDDTEFLIQRERVKEHFESFFATHADLNQPGKKVEFMQYVKDSGILDLDSAYKAMNHKLADADKGEMFDSIDRILDRANSVEEEEKAPSPFKDIEAKNEFERREKAHEIFNEEFDKRFEEPKAEPEVEVVADKMPIGEIGNE